jgi:glycosyltransferase involved in cell wall biosynthesis
LQQPKICFRIGDLTKVALIGTKGDFSKANGRGVHRYMYELYNGMKDKDKDVIIDKIEAPSLPIVHTAFGLTFLFANLFRDFSKYDVVHNLSLKPFFNLGRKRFVLLSTVHDLARFERGELGGTGKQSVKMKLWKGITVRLSLASVLRSDVIIAASSLTKRDLVRLLGFDSKRIFVINPGSGDARFFSKIKAKKRKRTFILGYVGSFLKKKNVEFAIRSFRKVKGREFRFEVWGNKAYEYERLLELSRGDDRIKFMGFAPEDKIVDIYDGFDAFVFPALYEGFALPIFEAKARGLPVIACKNAQIPEETLKYCFLAGDEEEMAKILVMLRKKGYDKKTMRRALEYARSFTWEKTCDNTIEIYKKAIKSREGI